jgi:lipoate-protein ligase B
MERHHFKVKEYVARLEEVLIQTLAGYGISAGRKTAYPGVWVGEQKIGMVGIQIKQHVTMHGFSLNVQPCLQDFGYIIPCGIANCQITSMAELLGGSAPTLTTLIPQLLRQFALIFEMSLVEISSEAANPDQELARELRPNSSTGE